MSKEYLRQDPKDVKPDPEPVGYFLVVNPKSHYFGLMVCEIERHEDWIKDSITGLWFKLSDLEESFEGGDAISGADDYLDDDDEEDSEKYLK